MIPTNDDIGILSRPHEVIYSEQSAIHRLFFENRQNNIIFTRAN